MDIRQQILLTLSYSDLFDYPLTQSEICDYIVSSAPIAHDQILTALGVLVGKYVAQKGTYYCLPGREKVIELRKKREKISRRKLLIATCVVRVLGFVPTIRLIALSGSLARNNADEQADIDLFIVTAPHTLWITRLIALGLLQLMGRRRQRTQREAANAVCLNMLVDASHMSFHHERQEMYTAQEICQLRVLYDSGNTYTSFCFANSWLRNYLANKPLPHYRKASVSLYQRLGTLSLALTEPISRRIQWQILRRHRSKEQVDEKMAAFHPFDYRMDVLNKMKKKEKYIASALWDIDKEIRINYTRNDRRVSSDYKQGFSFTRI